MLQPAGEGARKMNPCELTAAITAADNAMAQTADDEELNVLSAVLDKAKRSIRERTKDSDK